MVSSIFCRLNNFSTYLTLLLNVQYKNVAAVDPSTTDNSGKQQGNAPNKQTARWKKKVLKFLNEPAMQIFMGLLLMLTLFLADSFTLGNAPDSQNPALYSILLAIFIVFNLEMFTLIFIQEGYLGSFFFWMDLFGNFSIILDIEWIAGEFIPDGTIASQGSVVRATRAAKLGARYGRLLRIMRFMRLVKFLPCFRGLDAGEDFEPTMSAIKKVSDELSSVLSLRTAALVLILVIVVPFLSYTITDYSTDAWITNFKMLAKNESTTWYEIENAGRKMVHFYMPKDPIVKSIYVETPYFENAFEFSHKTREVLRSTNLMEYISHYTISNSVLLSSGNPYAIAKAGSDASGETEFEIKIQIDDTVHNQMNSMFNILVIILVIVVLFVFTGSFNSAVENLVVRPLEKMMTTLRNSAMVMLKSMKAYEENMDEDKKKEKADGDDSDEDDDEELETAMLEKMVEKLARIVKHVLPGANEIGVDENIDKNTANWLNQAYTSGPTVHNPKEAKAEIVITDDANDKLRMKQIEDSVSPEIRELLNTWDFDVLKYSNEELSNIMYYIFAKQGLLEEFKVPEQNFRSFLSEIGGRYINNTYHNYSHGVDVCFTAYRLMMIPGLTAVFSRLEFFAVLVGALAHDVGHPGLNNLFLVKSKHELAMQHNDRSPLENMHCVVLYDILSKDATNIFVGLEAAQWREARKVILTIILGTDMSHHFEQISKTQVSVFIFP